MIQINKMNENEINLIASKISEYDEFWNTNILKEEFKNNNSTYFVAKDDENILGFAGLWFNIDEAHIMNIAVKNKFRRKGIGTKLLAFLINYAQMKSKDCITLEVNEKNVAAYRLYKKMNFEEVGRRKKYYDNKFDAIIMTKKF